MSPRAPSTDPRVIRAALAYHETHSMNATANHFGVDHHTIRRWIRYRAERHSSWPTDQDIAIWDSKASRREKSALWKRRYVHRLHRNGGRPLMQPAHGTIRRLQALCAIGWTQGQLGARLGITSSRVSHIIRLTRTGVREDTARAVAALYEELCMQVPAGREASCARAYAKHKGWAPPLAWDDDTIDDPDARPQGLTESPYRHRNEFDENAVLRAMDGDRTVALSKAERAEVTRRLRARGWSSGRIEEHTGLKAERYAEVAA